MTQRSEEEMREYLVATGKRVTDLKTLEECWQEICDLIDDLEEFSVLAVRMEEIDQRWRGR